MNSSAYPAIPTVEADISDIFCAAKATGPVSVAMDEVRIRLEAHYHSCTPSFGDAIYPRCSTVPWSMSPRNMAKIICCFLFRLWFGDHTRIF